MSRCDCCNSVLTDYESSIKGKQSGQYLNTCLKCLKDLGIQYVGNHSLKIKKTEEDTVVSPISLHKPRWEANEWDDYE